MTVARNNRIECNLHSLSHNIQVTSRLYIPLVCIDDQGTEDDFRY